MRKSASWHKQQVTTISLSHHVVLFYVLYFHKMSWIQAMSNFSEKNHISVKNFRSLLSLVFIFSEGIWNFTIWKTTWARPFEYLGYYGSTPLPSSIKMLFSENYYFRMDLKFDITLIKMKIFGLSFFRQMWDFALSICKKNTDTLYSLKNKTSCLYFILIIIKFYVTKLNLFS